MRSIVLDELFDHAGKPDALTFEPEKAGDRAETGPDRVDDQIPDGVDKAAFLHVQPKYSIHRDFEYFPKRTDGKRDGKGNEPKGRGRRVVAIAREEIADE